MESPHIRAHSYGGKLEGNNLVRGARSRSYPFDRDLPARPLSTSFYDLDELVINHLEKSWRFSRWGIYQRWKQMGVLTRWNRELSSYGSSPTDYPSRMTESDYHMAVETSTPRSESPQTSRSSSTSLG